MATIQLNAQVSSDELLRAASQIDSSELNILADRILTLRAQRRVSNLTLAETDLLLKINIGLSDETWKRYNDLKTRLHEETISAEEHRELLSLIDNVETDNAKRLGHLVELAGLRGTTLDSLMRSLGIGPHTHARS